MGFRTVVVFNNDQLHNVARDHDIGRKINEASAWFLANHLEDTSRDGFRVIEVCHTDNVSLLLVDHLNGKEVGGSSWSHADKEVHAVKDAADRLGYRLVKKSVKKG